jgi:hypothetical protein
MPRRKYHTMKACRQSSMYSYLRIRWRLASSSGQLFLGAVLNVVKRFLPEIEPRPSSPVALHFTDTWHDSAHYLTYENPVKLLNCIWIVFGLYVVCVTFDAHLFSIFRIVYIFLWLGRRLGYWGLIPGRGKNFYLHHRVHTVSGAHPVSCQMGTGVWFPEGKAALHLHLVKGKVVPVLFFNWASRYEGVLGEWSNSFSHSLTSALDGVSGQLHAPAAFPPGKDPTGTHWVGGWVGPRAVLVDVKNARSDIWCWCWCLVQLFYSHDCSTGDVTVEYFATVWCELNVHNSAVQSRGQMKVLCWLWSVSYGRTLHLFRLMVP